jgi:hypothetical protein
MTDPGTTQAIFERFLQGQLSQAEAIDALIAAVRARKASGDSTDVLPIRPPVGITLSASDQSRAEALMASLDKRMSADR